jgi:hypothetical protein
VSQRDSATGKSSGEEADQPGADPYADVLGRLSAADRELLDRAVAARGRVLHDEAGEPVGTITAVLIDRETGRATWLVVDRAARTQSLVGAPVTGLEAFGDHYRIPVPAALIHDAPTIALTRVRAAVEQDLCQHYGVPMTRGASRQADRRATSSKAFQGPGWTDDLGWLPAPRGE